MEKNQVPEKTNRLAKTVLQFNVRMQHRRTEDDMRAQRKDESLKIRKGSFAKVHLHASKKSTYAPLCFWTFFERIFCCTF